jgi:hypothetical protein
MTLLRPAALVILLVSGCVQHVRDDNQPPGTVEVWLDREIGTVEGYGKPWPTDRTDPSGFATITVRETPCVCTVHFPSGGTYSSWTRTLILNQKHGRVTIVNVLPDPTPVSFSEALAEAERESKKLSYVDSALMQGHLKAWAMKTPVYSVSTGATIEERVELFLEIKPIPYQEGWFVSLEFYYLNDRQEELRPK